MSLVSDSDSDTSLDRSNEYETMHIRLIEQEMPKCERAHRRTDSSGNGRSTLECIDSSSARCRSPYGQIFLLLRSCVVFYDIGDANVTKRTNVQVAGNMVIDIDEGGKIIGEDQRPSNFNEFVWELSNEEQSIFSVSFLNKTTVT